MAILLFVIDICIGLKTVHRSAACDYMQHLRTIKSQHYITCWLTGYISVKSNVTLYNGFSVLLSPRLDPINLKNSVLDFCVVAMHSGFNMYY